MCDATIEIEISALGWAVLCGVVNEEKGFCKDHAPIAEWVGSVCSGCVGGFADCDLWRDIAYAGSKGLTEAQYSAIEHGICPMRTNGTFVVNTEDKSITDIDLSERASTESGKCFVQAIKDYRIRYFTPENEARHEA